MIRLYDLFAFLLAAAILVIGALFLDQFLTDAARATDVWPPWLTLLGVVSALFIAVWQQEKISQREVAQRKRKSVAVRAILPTVLVEVAHYAETCLDALTIFGGRAISVSAVASPFSENRDVGFRRPEVPTSSLLKIQECIEHADEPYQKILAELIQKIQIQNSRLRLLEGQSEIVSHRIRSSVVDTLVVYALCEKLFPYVRLETETAPDPLHSDEVIRAARLLRYGHNQDILDYIRSYFHS